MEPPATPRMGLDRDVAAQRAIDRFRHADSEEKMLLARRSLFDLYAPEVHEGIRGAWQAAGLSQEEQGKFSRRENMEELLRQIEAQLNIFLTPPWTDQGAPSLLPPWFLGNARIATKFRIQTLFPGREMNG